MKAGDVEAERAARAELAVVRLCRMVDEVRRSGVRLSVEQGEVVRGAVASVVGSAPAGAAPMPAAAGRVVPLRPEPEPRPVTKW